MFANLWKSLCFGWVRKVDEGAADQKTSGGNGQILTKITNSTTQTSQIDGAAVRLLAFREGDLVGFDSTI